MLLETFENIFQLYPMDILSGIFALIYFPFIAIKRGKIFKDSSDIRLFVALTTWFAGYFLFRVVPIIIKNL